MDATRPRWAGRLVDLDETECWELLATRPVGRIAWDDGDGPVALPVNFDVHEGSIRFRTSPYGALATGLVGQRVAFEVDDVEEFHESGWSVLVRGRARMSEIDPAGSRPTPWPEGQRALMIEVEAEQVTGRRLLGS